MSWEMVLRLIVAYGVDAAYKVWAIANTHEEPTEEAWTELRKLSLRSYEDYIAEARARATPPQPGIVHGP